MNYFLQFTAPGNIKERDIKRSGNSTICQTQLLYHGNETEPYEKLHLSSFCCDDCQDNIWIIQSKQKEGKLANEIVRQTLKDFQD